MVCDITELFFIRIKSTKTICKLIDEEGWYDLFEPNIKSVDDIYNNWFKGKINQYTFHHVTTHSLREYVLSKANKMKELVKEYRKKNPLITRRRL